MASLEIDTSLFTKSEPTKGFDSAITKFFQNPSQVQTYINEMELSTAREATFSDNLGDWRGTDLVIGIVNKGECEIDLLLKAKNGHVIDKVHCSLGRTMFIRPIPLVVLPSHPLRLEAEDGQRYPSLYLVQAILPNEMRQRIANDVSSLLPTDPRCPIPWSDLIQLQ